MYKTIAAIILCGGAYYLNEYFNMKIERIRRARYKSQGESRRIELIQYRKDCMMAEDVKRQERELAEELVRKEKVARRVVESSMFPICDARKQSARLMSHSRESVMGDKLYVGYNASFIDGCRPNTRANFFTLHVVANSEDEAFTILKKCAHEDAGVKITMRQCRKYGAHGWGVRELPNKPYLFCSVGGIEGGLDLYTFNTKEELAHYAWVYVHWNSMYRQKDIHELYPYAYMPKPYTTDPHIIDKWLQYANNALPKHAMKHPGSIMYWYTLNPMAEVGEWRPHRAHKYPHPYRKAMRALMLLAKTTNL